ncbi:MAG: hypothetical protein NT076_00470 [Candidatus Pacearchaeota archaeon]|nr:hypothetical protein [Candidatus Pacearchaeota archaeon]
MVLNHQIIDFLTWVIRSMKAEDLKEKERHEHVNDYKDLGKAKDGWEVIQARDQAALKRLAEE